MEKSCLFCGKKFEVLESKVKVGKGKYCSRECSHKARSVSIRGENHPNWNGGEVQQQCLQCGNEFLVKPSHIKKGGGKYCCKKCADVARIGLLAGEKNPNFKEKIKRICLNCGKNFEVVPNIVESGGGKYCCKNCFYEHSKKNNQIVKKCPICGKDFISYKNQDKICCSNKCAGLFRIQNNPQKIRVNCTCQICGKEFQTFPYRTKEGVKYCSRDCQAKGRVGKFVGENSPHFKEKILVKCIVCEKEFQTFPYRVRDGIKFCSNSCYNKFQLESGLMKGENNPLWKGGISFEPYCPKFNEKFRERVRGFFERKCYVCGKTEKELGKKLCVHHVNYDKKTCCNDSIPLFVALCHLCHIKTNRNRQKWKEYFEKRIMKEFNGKSYFRENEQINFY